MVEAVMGLDPAYWSNFGAGDLQGGEVSLEEGPLGVPAECEAAVWSGAAV